ADDPTSSISVSPHLLPRAGGRSSNTSRLPPRLLSRRRVPRSRANVSFSAHGGRHQRLGARVEISCPRTLPSTPAPAGHPRAPCTPSPLHVSTDGRSTTLVHRHGTRGGERQWSHICS